MIDFKKEVDFRLLIPEEDNDSINIQLLTGEYSGVVYSYGKVSVKEIEEDEHAELAFEYDLIDSNNIENLEDNPAFKDHIGNILVSIIMENIEKGK